MHKHVQSYLKSKTDSGARPMEAFKALTDELAISCRHYLEGITLLDYDMINSPKTHPVVIGSRSLILETETFSLVSKKFDRFFNYGECPDFYTDFDWNNAHVMEKSDGSLIGVYKYDGTYRISTRGMAYAEGPNQLNEGTFADAVLKAFGFKSNEEFQEFFNDVCDDQQTYVFEYTSPENRVVTPYSEPCMVLLSINKQDKEASIEVLRGCVETMCDAGYRVRMPVLYPVPDFKEDLPQIANELGGLAEGFVVWDPKTQKRVKVKSSLYVVAHSLRGNDPLPTRKNLLKLHFSGDMDEFLTYFPEWTSRAKVVTDEISNVVHDLNVAFAAHSGIESQKEFALAIKDLKYNGILFSARKTGSSPAHVMSGLSLEKSVSMFL